MQRYPNSENGGVSYFEIGEDYIRIKFNGSAIVYTYTHAKPGRNHVEEMKLLAAKGKGLTTYINKHIRENYDWKK